MFGTLVGSDPGVRTFSLRLPMESLGSRVRTHQRTKNAFSGGDQSLRKDWLHLAKGTKGDLALPCMILKTCQLGTRQYLHREILNYFRKYNIWRTGGRLLFSANDNCCSSSIIWRAHCMQATKHNQNWPAGITQKSTWMFNILWQSHDISISPLSYLVFSQLYHIYAAKVFVVLSITILKP